MPLIHIRSMDLEHAIDLYDCKLDIYQWKMDSNRHAK